MSFDDLMPEELWIEILQDLPKETLQNVALSHRTLGRISRPFLFVTFVFHPYAVVSIPQNINRMRWPEADEPLLLSQEAQDRELERLNFWSSAEIAPLVRTCRLIPASAAHLHPVLPCVYGSLHADRAGNLCLLPALSRLEIILGTIVEPIDCHSLHLGRITSFQLRHARHSIPPLDSWMRLLPPDPTRRNVFRIRSRLFADIKHSDIPPFPHVRKLTLQALRVGDRIRPLIASSVLPILSKFMGVEVLVMEGYWTHSEHGPSGFSGPLPILKEYDGPQEMLPILLSRLTLSHITIGWIDWPWIAEMLHASPPSGSIVSLTASSGPITSADFGFLFKIFPFLSELNLNIGHGQRDSPNSLRKAFFENITTVPTSLELLTIRWKHFEAEDSSSSDIEDDASTPDRRNHASTADKLHHVAELRTLVARCPALISLWIETQDFFFRWHRLSDGTIDEQTVLDMDGVDNLRNEWAVFWNRK
ncbi:hypothetical protein B0H14DRAFT_2817711 [Mycena olivaceomarginata]|nr:hypothetical protein B0H14DRAFT_2817711 [Mycena olivaceomarginata]